MITGAHLYRYTFTLIVRIICFPKLHCREDHVTEFGSGNLSSQKAGAEGCRFASIQLKVELNLAKCHHTKLWLCFGGWRCVTFCLKVLISDWTV
jgi:hypothetical protein